MPREQQAAAQKDDAGTCAAPQLDADEMRSRKRGLFQAILSVYTEKRHLVTQGLVLQMAIQACIKHVQDQQKTNDDLDTTQAMLLFLEKSNRDDLRDSMEPLIEVYLDGLRGDNSELIKASHFEVSDEDYEVIAESITPLDLFQDFIHQMDYNDRRRSLWMAQVSEAAKDAAGDEEDAAVHGLGAGMTFDPGVVGPRNPEPATMDTILDVVDKLRATVRLLHAAVVSSTDSKAAGTPQSLSTQPPHRVYQQEFFVAVGGFEKKTERLALGDRLSKSATTAYQSEEQAKRADRWKKLRGQYYALGLVRFDPTKKGDTWAKVPLNDKVTMYKMAFDELKLHPEDFELMMKSKCFVCLCLFDYIPTLTYLPLLCSILGEPARVFQQETQQLEEALRPSRGTYLVYYWYTILLHGIPIVYQVMPIGIPMVYQYK